MKNPPAHRPARGSAPDEKPARVNDPEQTRRDIIAVATEEFADKGLSGARIDEIAARTRTSKRMIYYYFGSKEGLYVAVLEEAYRNIRNIELRELVSFTFDRHQQNPAFVRIVMNENLHSGKYIAQSAHIPKLNVPAIDTIRRIVERGKKTGAFRADIDPVDLHMSISALCFYSVTTRHTFSTIFKAVKRGMAYEFSGWFRATSPRLAATVPKSSSTTWRNSTAASSGLFG